MRHRKSPVYIATSMAPWRSGDAADCKSVYPGSIPGGTSNNIFKSLFLLHYLKFSKNIPTFIPTFKPCFIYEFVCFDLKKNLQKVTENLAICEGAEA